jgi:hypothetical protein
MTQIRSLFDPDKGINRSIEKVISYQISQEERLKAEIREYIVTESIESQLERLLENIQAAMESGGGHEVGVWVSGFYGSGKSSFTKYLGLAFDQRVQLDGQPFLKHLQDRFHKPQTKALLSAVAARFPAAVVMLDLASEQIAGATLAEVSTVLYYKVLQYAGYSRNLKVAALERRARKDGRFAEFEAMFREATQGQEWADYRNDELVADSLLPGIARRLYPGLFSSDQSFTTASSEVIYLMDDRVQEMIDIVREASGKEYIIFVIDEIGQYVGSYQNKILDLQGLAENLKNLGSGKVWIVGTAQQTLTEDDPRAIINSPELFKLKDRFPITVELESSDIKEICYRRLLGKSSAGGKQLGERFDQHGQALRHNTKLVDAKYYDTDLDRETFINLYPFLPAHFEILLHLLGALAKSTGGIGLRSAIKVIQDILLEDNAGTPPVADREVGELATTVALYDSLETDIRRAFPSVYHSVGKVPIIFHGDDLKLRIAKTIAILQILGNMPVTTQNVTSLMHPAIDSPSLAQQIKESVDAMVKEPRVPLGEQGGALRFLSEKLTDIDHERAQLAPRSADRTRIFNETLRSVFEPLPIARVANTMMVTSGIKHRSGAGSALALAGEREVVQTVVAFAEPSDYEATRTRLLDESRQRSSENTIYLLGRAAPAVHDLTAEIRRCQRIVELHQNDPDQEVRDYCAGQSERANRLISNDLAPLVIRSLAQGSFLFRGSATAVQSIDTSLPDACRKHLGEAAQRIFDRYQEAPVRVATELAEKFLRAAGANLRGVSSTIDPLSLVKIAGNKAQVDTGHKALVSIRDAIERTGTMEGRALLDAFGRPPFGWSPDTTRYLVAALLVAGEIKLKVSGREVAVNGQQAIDALKSNAAVKSVGVSLRDDRPSMDVLARASTRLTELCGDAVVPLEDAIAKAAQKRLPDLQHRLGPLAERLKALHLPGAETVESVNRQITDIMMSDASDAPQRFGAEESPLYDGLKWALAARTALDQGLDGTVRQLRTLAGAIKELPATGAPGELRAAADDDLKAVEDKLSSDDFIKHGPDLSTALTSLQASVTSTVRAMAQSQAQRLQEAGQDIERLPEWSLFTQEEQSNALAKLGGFTVTASADVAGLKQLIARQYDIENTVSDIKKRIADDARDRERRARTEATGGGFREGGSGEGSGDSTGIREITPRTRRLLAVPARINTTADLDRLISRLQALRAELAFAEFDVEITRG